MGDCSELCFVLSYYGEFWTSVWLMSYLSSILFYKGQNWSSERCCDLPRIIQLTGSKVRIQTQAYLASSTSPAPNLHSLFMIHPCTCVCPLTHTHSRTPHPFQLWNPPSFSLLSAFIYAVPTDWNALYWTVQLLYSIWTVHLMGLSSDLTTSERPFLILWCKLTPPSRYCLYQNPSLPFLQNWIFIYMLV